MINLKGAVAATLSAATLFGMSGVLAAQPASAATCAEKAWTDGTTWGGQCNTSLGYFRAVAICTDGIEHTADKWSKSGESSYVYCSKYYSKYKSNGHYQFSSQPR